MLSLRGFPVAQMVNSLPAMQKTWVPSLGQKDPLKKGMAVFVQSLNHVQFFVTLWTAACQAPLSMGFSRQEYWNGLLFPPPWDLPHPDVMIVFTFYSLFRRSLFDLKSVYLYHRVLFSNKEPGKYRLFNA